MKTCMFLHFHVHFKHESTKPCFYVFSPFSALPLHHNGKGSIGAPTCTCSDTYKYICSIRTESGYICSRDYMCSTRQLQQMYL